MSESRKSPKLAVIDYGMGNLRSVVKAWQAVGADASLIQTPEEAESADALVFPGQGAIVDTMQLLAKTGLDQLIKDWIEQDRPFFGICLGFQALFEFSEEGNTQGLGIFEGSVKRFPNASETQLKVPHMGWNSVRFQEDSTLTEGITSGEDQFYFVHSYYVEPKNKALHLFETEYGKPFCSGIRSGNCVAVQSRNKTQQVKGLQLYSNFLKTINS
ncbi:MAG: imidazole glycerol phosphate synthase subunit HisH [Verrucomicrobia bacterium]|nr:imidazole glycerol phosphate synthase subunit HisH [Verrucomicrobiota bacterium]